ncbi:MAG: helix-turn-helix transcriptional regulator [Gammaproteobacteria bacterium]
MFIENRKSVRHLLARHIRILRILRGWSQEQLADYCGLHRTFIGAVERAERNITVDNIEKIAIAFEIPVSGLFGDGDLLQWADGPNKNCVEEPRASYYPTPVWRLPSGHGSFHFGAYH